MEFQLGFPRGEIMFRSKSSSVAQALIRKASIFFIIMAVSLSASFQVFAQETASRAVKAKRSATKPAPAAKPAPAVPAVAQQQEPAGAMVGSPWTGQFGVQKTTAELMEEERQSAGGPQPEETEFKKIRPDRKGLPLNPESPEVSRWPAQEARESEEPQLQVQTPSTSFTGATLTETNAFPPDTMGAVGPTQFLVGVNGRLKVFDKNTGAVGPLNVSMNTFFNSVRNGAGTSDPRVRFDRLSNRWLVLIINVAAPNRILLAVSDTATITAGTVWTFFFFQQDTVSPAGDTGCLSDYPTLGIDANALYIGVNQFCGSPLLFGGTTAFVVRKSSVLGAGPIVVSAFRNLTGGPGGAGPFTPQGVDNFATSAPEGYLIGVDNATFGTLMMRRVTNAATTPVMSANIAITVPSTTFPITVRHQGNTGGTNGQLDGLDDRLFAAYLRNGSIWTAHNIGVNNTGTTTGTRTRNGSRWYEISGVSSATPAVAQSGTLFAQTGSNDFDQRNFWIPSVMVSGQGHMALGASIAGTNEFVNGVTAGRLASDAPGTLRTPIALTTSTTAYNPPGDDGARGARRWGDYSYTSLDPCDDMTMWTIQEFCDATNSYAVRVVKLLAPPPATPVSASPSSIAAGQPSVNVTITGTQIDGSAFYDPGSGFSCRPGATITGGVTVNSITVNSPTSVTLNLSTVSATSGAKNVTITNPDGQNRTGTGILTISGGTSCSFSINPTSQNFSSSGGTGSTSVTAGAGCAWTAVSNDSFITITSGASGSGNGTVNFSVQANPDQSPRAGTLTVAGETFTVNQDAAPSCSYSISPTSDVFSAAASNGTISITSPSGCPWTAQSNASFISLTSASSGSGTGFVTFSVTANSTTAVRTGTITVAGLTYSLTQTAGSCMTSINPTSRTFTPNGGSGAITVSAATNCNWSSLSSVPWISIISNGSGPGSKTIKYTVSANTLPVQRSGIIAVGRFIHTVIQSAAACTFSISPSSQSFSDGGGAGTVNVSAPAGCNWTAQSNAAFITITTSSSGSGNGAVNYSVASNPSSSLRSGTMTIAGRTFTVTQSGAGGGCTFSINPSSQSFASGGGSGTANVSAGTGCNWTAVSNAAFITITAGSSGSGSGQVSFSVQPNSTTSTRTGTMTIAGQTFTVTQTGVASCTFSISPTNASYRKPGGSGTVNVTTAAGCEWTAVSNVAWITVTSGSSGSGNGSVSYSVAVNNSGSTRTGTVTIAGKTFSVKQASF